MPDFSKIVCYRLSSVTNTNTGTSPAGIPRYPVQSEPHPTDSLPIHPDV